MKTTKIVAVLIVILGALSSVAYSTRAFNPYPRNYVERLEWLRGSRAVSGGGFYGLNCSGFIANAHGRDYMEANEMYQGGNGKLEIVAEVSSLREISHVALQPGDVAAFEGIRQVKGVHVAAFLGLDRWIDADARRGNVREFDISTRAGDPWFAGKVRILRWRVA